MWLSIVKTGRGVLAVGLHRSFVGFRVVKTKMTADSLLPTFRSRWAGRLSAPVRRSRRRWPVARRKIGSGGADPNGQTADPWGDPLHRMTRIEQSGQSGGNEVAEKRIDFAYDAASQWQTITRYADLVGTKLVAQSDYTFDAAARLTALAHAHGDTTLPGWEDHGVVTFSICDTKIYLDRRFQGGVDHIAFEPHKDLIYRSEDLERYQKEYERREAEKQRRPAIKEGYERLPPAYWQ